MPNDIFMQRSILFLGGVASTFTSSVLVNTRLLPALELPERAGERKSFRAGLWCHSTP